MSDDQTQDAVVAAEADDTGVTDVGAIGDETGVQAAGGLVTDYDYAALVAAFDDDEAAYSAYEALQDAETSGGLGIFFPPVIIASTVVVGGVLGRIRNEWHKSEVGDELTGFLGPDQSGPLVLAQASHVDAVKAAMPQATKVRTAGVDDATAAQITDAAMKAS